MTTPNHQILTPFQPLPVNCLNDNPAPKSCNLYVLVAPCLYRNTKTGNYYGAKKLHGRRKERSLKTADRKIAERRLKEWIANLEKVDSEVEKTTLRQLIDKLVAVNRGNAQNTQVTLRAIIKNFLAWWPYGADIQVRNIRPSQLDEWLALQEPRLRNTSYNRYAGFLKQLFEIAVNDRIIAESPCTRLKTPWKKPQTPVRHIPSVQQFEAIVACIRSQKFSDTAEVSADFIEFLGLAGLGQAEASSLTWGDVDWELNRLNVRRRKTDTHFHVPIYPHLRPLLARLLKQAGGRPSRKTLVFKVKDAKKALQTACNTLGFLPYSQRSMRQCLILRLWKAGVDKKLIAKWQGHQDGGELILQVYTEAFGEDAEYEQQQLAKLAA
jgi:integrase